MPKTRINKTRINKTRIIKTKKTIKNEKTTFSNRNRNYLFENFQKEITVVFFEILLMVKLYHWKTISYATHKATDELYEKLNKNMDSFIEILLGKSGIRTNLTSKKNINLIDLTSPEALKKEIETFKGYLVSLNNHKTMKIMDNSDLYTIRDEILGNMNQFLYLLTFK